VIIDRSTACPARLTKLVSGDPYFAFRNALVALAGFRRHPDPIDAPEADGAGRRISPRSTVHPSALVGEGSIVHPFASIGAEASVGRRCVIYPGCWVGERARIGDDCVLHPNVVIYDRCTLGDRVILHSGTVIGHDGFGYATHGGAHHKIPQSGIAVIEDDVEMGAACAIECAAMGETRIGRGTKLADLISIGHGTTIGAHCLLVSLVGVSGSVRMGNYVVLGGQSGIAGHLALGDGVQVAAKAAVAGDIPAGKKVGGIPAIDIDLAKRNVLAAQSLYEMSKRLKQLEREVQRLQGGAEP
jgi:UDP-3-O-[3-hydroxymyristoyl] glucosamine N-acyltransferase